MRISRHKLWTTPPTLCQCTNPLALPLRALSAELVPSRASASLRENDNRAVHPGTVASPGGTSLQAKKAQRKDEKTTSQTRAAAGSLNKPRVVEDSKQNFRSDPHGQGTKQNNELVPAKKKEHGFIYAGMGTTCPSQHTGGSVPGSFSIATLGWRQGDCPRVAVEYK